MVVADLQQDEDDDDFTPVNEARTTPQPLRVATAAQPLKRADEQSSLHRRRSWFNCLFCCCTYTDDADLIQYHSSSQRELGGFARQQSTSIDRLAAQQYELDDFGRKSNAGQSAQEDDIAAGVQTPDTSGSDLRLNDSDTSQQRIDKSQSLNRRQSPHLLTVRRQSGRNTMDEMLNIIEQYKSAIRRAPPSLKAQFKFNSLLGWGGNGFVVDAVELKTGSSVAVKFLSKVDYKDANTRIRDADGHMVPHEVYNLRRLRQIQGIVKLLDYQESATHYLLVLEKIEQFVDAPYSTAAEDDGTVKLVKSPNSKSMPSKLKQQDSEKERDFTQSRQSSTSDIKRTTRCDMGSLFHFTQTRQNVIKRPAVYKSIFKQLVTICSKIHASKMCYLDFKGENIMIQEVVPSKQVESTKRNWLRPLASKPQQSTETMSEKYIAKLVDFGMSRDYGARGQMKFQRYGTIYMSAPEILTEHEFQGPEADVWALGLILFSMVSGGRDAFPAPYEREVVEYARQPYQLQVGTEDQSVKLIIERSLNPSHDRRATITELVALTLEWP